MNKIIKYCKDRGIDIVLVKTPRTDWTAARHNAMEKYASENGVEFLDFNDVSMFKAVGFDSKSDFLDNVHINFLGAKKFSAYIGSYLRNNYALPDARNDDKYSQWSEDYLIYEQEYNSRKEKLYAELSQ